MSPDQLTFDNPVERHAHLVPHAQWQPFPGLDAGLSPRADHGETTYRGTGRLVGRKALITGADSGIGAAVAIAFAREGADVAMTYLPAEAEDADAVAEVVRAEGRTAVQIPGDITDREFCRRLVAEAVEGLGGLDILVNNAAYQVYHQTFDELDEENLDQTIRTNLYALFWITRDALPHLGPGSTIINSTSVQGYNPSPMIINYATTKFGINGFTKALAQDLAPRGIRVNAVAPGPVWTPLQVTDGQPPEKLEGFGSSSWLGRTSQPVEQAPAYVFLASPESSFVVGEVINVNGGANVP
ncbi:MAG: SDR family oxidoreductase [Demequina sp.]|nr:SDR family oxidoreductase [Demequina sp.]